MSRNSAGPMIELMIRCRLVPAALLELKPYAVIRVQIATALPLLAANLVLMYFIVFRASL